MEPAVCFRAWVYKITIFKRGMSHVEPLVRGLVGEPVSQESLRLEIVMVNIIPTQMVEPHEVRLREGLVS